MRFCNSQGKSGLWVKCRGWRGEASARVTSFYYERLQLDSGQLVDQRVGRKSSTFHVVNPVYSDVYRLALYIATWLIVVFDSGDLCV
jgi:hypothetical protein